MSLEGFDHEQRVILQYDADNIIPGTVSLGPATIPLPQNRLDALARAGNPQIRTLSLILKSACPVWCMPLSGSLVARSGYEKDFGHLANLAKATEINVLFDYNWLHRGVHSRLQRLVEHTDELRGFPAHQRYRQQRYRKVDWNVFDTKGADAFADVDATTEDEEPPPVYAEASSKRPRHVLCSPTPCSPRSKRVLLSPFVGELHTSPTEKGSTATPSPEPPKPFSEFPLLAASSPIPTDLPSAVAHNLPEPIQPALATPASDIQRTVEDALTSLLPDIVERLLPSILPRLLAPSSLASSSQHSPASQISHAPAPPNLNALGISLHDRLASQIEGEVRSLYTHTLSHANWLRNTADDTFGAMLEDERLALDRAAEEMFEDFKEQCEGAQEDIFERVAWKLEEMGESLTDRLAREKKSLEHEREELRREREEFMRDKEELRRDKQDVRREKKELRKERQSLRRRRRQVEGAIEKAAEDAAEGGTKITERAEEEDRLASTTT